MSKKKNLFEQMLKALGDKDSSLKALIDDIDKAMQGLQNSSGNAESTAGQDRQQAARRLAERAAIAKTNNHRKKARETERLQKVHANSSISPDQIKPMKRRLKAQKFPVSALYDAEIDTITSQTGAHTLDKLLALRDADGRAYASLAALRADHGYDVDKLLRHRPLHADLLLRIAVILHRCGLRNDAGALHFDRMKKPARLLAEVSHELEGQTRTITNAQDATRLLTICADPDGTADALNCGIHPDWNTPALPCFASFAFSVLKDTNAVKHVATLRPLLQKLCAKWDAAPDACGETVADMRLASACFLGEVNLIGMWFTPDVVENETLKNLIALVPDTPVLWQLLAEKERASLMPQHYYLDSNFVKNTVKMLTQERDPARREALKAATGRLVDHARAHLTEPQSSTLPETYNLHEIHKIHTQLQNAPAPLETAHPYAAAGPADPQLVLAPAVLMRPVMDCEASAETPFKMGGNPQLPPAIDWPVSDFGVPLHFYAQVDFAHLPRRLEVNNHSFDMPAFPTRGTLFIFHALADTAIFETAPVLIFTPDDVSALPERTPPGKTPRMRDADATFLRSDGITRNATALIRQQLEPIAYMSARPNLWATGEDGKRIEIESPTPLTPDLTAALTQDGLQPTLNDRHKRPSPRSSGKWDAYVHRSTQIKPDAKEVRYTQGSDMQPFQFFGHGDNVQNAALEQRGKIMLLQIGNNFGTPVTMPDIVIQMWIDPEDLAMGQFDNVVWTQDCS